MSVRLIRESSDTPNITNRDDARMVRYAYGGINGVMKDFGSELSYSISGSKFKLSPGRIVLQGWEVDVDGAGWELDLSTVIGTQYHLVYLEINVSIESAVIKSAYLTGSIPVIDLGDDLTQSPEGTARLPLYSFIVSNRTISSVKKECPLLSYYGPRFDNIEERLDRLGFREGSVVLPEVGTSETVVTVAENTLTRQGNYVIGRFKVTLSGNDYFSDMVDKFKNFGAVSEEFLPLENRQIYMRLYGSDLWYFSPGTGSIYPISQLIDFNIPIYISKDTGEILLVDSTVYLLHEYFKPYNFEIDFGYEAAPL